MRLVEEATCRHCGMEEETYLHILCDFPALWRERLEHLGVAMGPTEQKELTALARFAMSVRVV